MNYWKFDKMIIDCTFFSGVHRKNDCAFSESHFYEKLLSLSETWEKNLKEKLEKKKKLVLNFLPIYNGNAIGYCSHNKRSQKITKEKLRNFQY